MTLTDVCTFCLKSYNSPNASVYSVEYCTVNKKSFCKLLASKQKLYLQSSSPKDFYFPYKVLCARALIATRVAQFLLKIAQHVLNMVPRGLRACGLRPRLWLLASIMIDGIIIELIMEWVHYQPVTVLIIIGL